MQQAYIVSAVRTPFGRFGGALADVSPVDLGAISMRAALQRAGLPGELDGVERATRRGCPQPCQMHRGC
jgi:acetyl-CoA acetyltransferase